MLIESWCHLHILEEVGVSGKDVCLVWGEYLSQTVGIENVVDGLHLVPCGCVHVQYHHHVLRHIAEVAFEPLQFGIGKLLLILASATIVDVLHCDDVATSDIERVVYGSEVLAEHFFGIFLHARFRVVQVGVALVEVVVADTLEESHTAAFDGVDILRIKRHVVKHHVAKRHSYHVARLAQPACRMHYVVNRLVAPSFHVVSIEYLRVAHYDVVEAVGYGVASLQCELVGSAVGNSLAYGNVVARSQSVLLWQYIFAWSGYGDKLAHRCVGRHFPCAAFVCAAELASVVDHYALNTDSVLIDDGAAQHHSLVIGASADKCGKQKQSDEDSQAHNSYPFGLHKFIR